MHTSFDADERSHLRRVIDRAKLLASYFPAATRRECIKDALWDVAADEYTARAEDRAVERAERFGRGY